MEQNEMDAFSAGVRFGFRWMRDEIMKKIQELDPFYLKIIQKQPIEQLQRTIYVTVHNLQVKPPQQDAYLDKAQEEIDSVRRWRQGE